MTIDELATEILVNWDARPKTRWQDKPPTDKQLEVMRRNGIRVRENETRGTADHHIAKRTMSMCLWRVK